MTDSSFPAYIQLLAFLSLFIEIFVTLWDDIEPNQASQQINLDAHQATCHRSIMAGIAYKTHGKFALELERQGLTIVQVVMCANVIRCPMSPGSRAILLSRVKITPFKTSASPYRVQTSRRGKNKAIQEFSIGLQLMGATPDDYLDGRVSANRLAFACWVASVVRDPIVLADVSRGLTAGYRCPVSVNKLSDWINGHREMIGTAPALLSEVLAVLSRPVEDVRQLELALKLAPNNEVAIH